MYAELHAKTNFSFLEGASHPEEMVRRAAELGYAALAATDRNSLAGIVRAHGAAKDIGLKLVVGAEITPEDAPPLVLWATDRAGYGRLARLITLGRRRAEKGACRLLLEDVAAHADGLLAGIVAEGRGVQGSGFRVQGSEVERLAASRRVPLPACPAVPWRRVDAAAKRPSPLAPRPFSRYRDIFPGRCYLLAELHHGPDDRRLLEQLKGLSQRTGVPLAAAGGAYFHAPERRALCDVLTAVRLGTTVAEAGEHLFPNAERHLKPPAEMAALFAGAPEAIRRALEIAERCRFSLDELRYEYPEELAPPGRTPMEYLAELARRGAAERYPGGVPEKVRRLVEHELRLIEELGYEAYFLTVWDLVRFARGRGILCQGRGSAANSAVCYCLGVTSVDPERSDLLFERFVSRERNEAPDIDVDFEHERREEVIQYVYEKYGRERAGMTAEVITYRPRSAVRDVGKALGLPAERIDALAKQLEHFREEPDLAARCRESGIDPASTAGRQLVERVGEIVGFPRHLSQHTGGMVITRGPLCELVPIENAAMPERTVIQWNKDDLDELGVLKVDCLALGMLTAVRKCFELLGEHEGLALGLADVPPEDERVYDMICRADTTGVFQIESRAQMSMLPRLRPRCFYDLVIEVAIVRPGPIQGDMVHPYLRRRNGEETVEYPDESIREVLGKTLGVPLFQEQAMRLAVVAAGFTPGEADQLRRAMGAWRRPGVIEQFRRKLIDGMLARGFSPRYAESVFNQIRGFGDYGFPESHAASFALLVYVSAWLKCHHQAAFTCALLNSQPMGFYAPAQLVRDARNHGVEVRPADVNFSAWDCTLERGQGPGVGGRGSGFRVRGSEIEPLAASHRVPLPACPAVPRRRLDAAAKRNRKSEIINLKSEISPPSSPATRPAPLTLRLGFRMLAGMSRADAERIAAARGERPFRSIEEFARRTGLGRAALRRLADAGAFASLGRNRRAALWDALAEDRRAMPLFEGSGAGGQGSGPLAASHTSPLAASHKKHLDDATLFLPEMSPAEEVLADYRAAGLSLRNHPMALLRAMLDERKVLPAAELKRLDHGRPVGVAGIVLVRQRPGTAKGITFITLEDETGTANLIVRPDVWRRFRHAALGATLLLAHGRLQRQGEVIHVLCTRLENVSELAQRLGPQSRDFR
jgi:error-prone DNA polymerase